MSPYQLTLKELRSNLWTCCLSCLTIYIIHNSYIISQPINYGSSIFGVYIFFIFTGVINTHLWRDKCACNFLRKDRSCVGKNSFIFIIDLIVHSIDVTQVNFRYKIDAIIFNELTFTILLP